MREPSLSTDWSGNSRGFIFSVFSFVVNRTLPDLARRWGSAAALGILWAVLGWAATAQAQILTDLRDRTEFRLGGDVNLRKFTGGASAPLSFSLGQFDAFLYVQLTPQFSVLSEVVLEA